MAAAAGARVLLHRQCTRQMLPACCLAGQPHASSNPPPPAPRPPLQIYEYPWRTTTTSASRSSSADAADEGADYQQPDRRLRYSVQVGSNCSPAHLLHPVVAAAAASAPPL